MFKFIKRLFKGGGKPIEAIKDVVKTPEMQLRELVKTVRYATSKYKIQLVNDSYYMLKNTESGNWVDLKSNSHEHSVGSTFFKDCKGELSDVIRVFNDLVPYIETIESVKTITEKSENMDMLIDKI